MEKEVHIALAGNPNSGKTTMFNDLTGSLQYVGNWPGVTVEKKEGRYTRDNNVVVTDLPGVYSLSPYSPEEVVTRDYLSEGSVDAVIDIIDATNLERNLYLTTQILELGLPTVIALNMMDLVRKNGHEIDTEKLSRQLGCPVVETSALKGEGLDGLIQTAITAAKKGETPKPQLRFNDVVERALTYITRLLRTKVPPRLARWYAVKLLEGEVKPQSDYDFTLSEDERAQIARFRTRIESVLDDDIESIIASGRYDAITALVADSVIAPDHGLTATHKIDQVVTNRILGLPIFVIIMTLVYFIAVSTVGTYATQWVNTGVFGDGWLYSGGAAYETALAGWDSAPTGPAPDPADFGFFVPGIPAVLGPWMESVGAAPWLQSLVLDGILGGVGAVLGFVPQMIVLFFLLSFLEDCGYMARVAFLMDRIFHKFGLSGKSFIPMLIASGCGVPAIMATKTIENENDRRMTIMTATMIPCGAKLPVIALVFGAVAGGDPAHTWWIAPLFYFLGVFAIIISGMMLKKLRSFAGEATPFIMELPSYHLPSAQSLVMHTWERVKSFIVKAGTIIFLCSIALWALLNFGFYDGRFGILDPTMPDYLSYSLIAMVGKAFAWLFVPLGFGSWEPVVTTLTGLAAKENLVATVGVLSNLGDAGQASVSLQAAFANMFGNSTPAIIAFCAFNLLCAPCLAAMSAIHTQMESAKWTWFALGYMTVFAWCIGLIIYQLGGLFTGEGSFTPWTGVAFLVLAAILFQVFRPMPHYGKKAEPESVGNL